MHIIYHNRFVGDMHTFSVMKYIYLVVHKVGAALSHRYGIAVAVVMQSIGWGYVC